MRTIAFIVLSLLLFSCKTAQRPKMTTPLDETVTRSPSFSGQLGALSYYSFFCSICVLPQF